MKHKEIANGLIELGFNSGWVVTGEEITLWEHPEPQPNYATIQVAAEEYKTTQEIKAQNQIAAKEAAEAKLAALGLTADDLKALGL